MCDPISIGLMALTAGAALFSNSSDTPHQQQYQPPPTPTVESIAADTPAPTSAGARASGAVVRIGDPLNKTPDALVPEYDGFVERRVSGKALGGLGRGGLGL